MESKVEASRKALREGETTSRNKIQVLEKENQGLIQKFEIIKIKLG